MGKLTVLDERGEIVRPGDVFEDFRGDLATLVYPTRATEVGKAGKVTVRYGSLGMHRELYATCFNFTVVQA